MWLFLLYGVAAILALRSLLTLMDQHRRAYKYVLKKELARLEAEAADQKAVDALEAQLDAASDQMAGSPR